MPANRAHRERAEELLADIAGEAHTDRELTAMAAVAEAVPAVADVLPRLEEFEGVSVFYAAAPVEARTCRDGPVAVVGSGNSAGQAALYLARHAARVYLLVRGDDLRKDMSRYLADQLQRGPRRGDPATH